MSELTYRSVNEDSLRHWANLLNSVNPPLVTYSHDKLEMANEAAHNCMRVARRVADDIEACLNGNHHKRGQGQHWTLEDDPRIEDKNQ